MVLDPPLEKRILHLLGQRSVNLEQPRGLAEQVLQLSAFYLQNTGDPTPWRKPFAANAYLAYFLPLNFVRLKAVFRDVRRFLPEKTFNEIWDFGSGLGTTQWVLESEADLGPHPFYAIESGETAIALHQELIHIRKCQWEPRFVKKATPQPGALAVFSYSFLEMQRELPPLEDFVHLLIVEPSTRDLGRSLMQWRAKLIGAGFFPLAPCTHSQDCPLLVHSNKDWCHQRIPFEQPAWFHAMEQHLPMKNRTLTYSYLLMSRTVRDTTWRGTARVIGDTLEENGKTRQMICRGPEREFLSWLHKKGEPLRIPHGSLVRGTEQAEKRGSEIRPEPGSLSWDQ